MDKYKDLKKYFNRCYKYTKEKRTLERELKQKIKEIDSISASNDEIKNSCNVSKVELRAIELIDLENRIALYEEAIYKVKQEISDDIDMLEDDRLRKVLTLRYLDFMKWEDIAYILNYSNKHIFKLHNKALETLVECSLKILLKKDTL